MGRSMKAINKIQYYMKAALVIAVALAFVVPTSAVITNPMFAKTSQSVKYETSQSAIHKSLPTGGARGTDVLVSVDNPSQDDETPKITRNTQGTIVVTYEKQIDALLRHAAVVYSPDNGQSWTEQFEFDTTGLQGSEYLQSVDIKYSLAAGQFFWHGIDPFATQYNEEHYWIPGDIANATEAMGFGISGQGASDYTEGALGVVGEWSIGLSIETNYGIINDPGLGYWWWDGVPTDNPKNPIDVNASWAHGFYYDGGSILKTSEASQPEMATGNNLYMVMQSYNGAYSNISFKATSTDLNPYSPTFLLTQGGGPGGMDKFADIEAWPFKQAYVAVDATDPEIGAKGNVVAVVYDQGGDVKCTTSIDGGLNFTISSTVATGAAYPAAYVAANKIYVAYVKDGNLFYVASSDNGATWGAPTQINDQAGTVVAQPGTVDVDASGFVWTDSRNGKYDIYFEYTELEPPTQVPKLVVSKVTGGIGVKATIGNTGDAPATNVQWTIKVTGGILGLIKVNANGSIPSLAVGTESTGKTKIIIGLGTISVDVAATCDEGPTVSVTKTGKQLLFFTTIAA